MATKQELKLTIEARLGHADSTSARRLRAEGKLPAVLYGHGDAPQHVAVDAKAFDELLHKGGRNGIITLVSGGKIETAMVRDVQRHQVTHKIVHADLQRVSATESIHTKLPIVTVGVAIGVKEFGGVMDIVAHDIEIEGPANRLPEHLEVDVTALGIHDHILAGDVKLPSGFKLLTPADATVVIVEPSKTAQAIEEVDAGIAAVQAEPEVIGEAPPEAPAS
ncbi:MAG: 50S ribosomal protein L25 [Candidatus Eremiobacteraeota bacterium]|nr:50S ribosomal protein L25 [Candidatus Eremiobacteraeota bacterium]